MVLLEWITRHTARPRRTDTTGELHKDRFRSLYAKQSKQYTESPLGGQGE